MAMYAINYDGLRKRDTYNELIDYLQFGQEKIIYPDRFAKRLRESPQISNLLDGEGFGKKELEEQQLSHMKELMKEFAVRQAGGTAQFSRAEPANNNSNVNNGNSPNYDAPFQDQGDNISQTVNENNRNKENRNQNTAERNRQNLNAVHQQNTAGLLGAHNMLESPNVTERRQEQYNSQRNPQFYLRKETNRFNEELRQKVERNKDLQNKRSTASSSQSPQQFNISTPPPSPRFEYDSRLEGKYNKRLVESMANRKPTVQKQRPPETQKQDREEQLQQKRTSAAQIAKKEKGKKNQTQRGQDRKPHTVRVKRKYDII